MSSMDMKKALGARSWTKKTVAIVLFTMIILVFIFWGIYQGGNGTGAPGFAAVVNRNTITRAELQSEAQRIEQFYAQFMGSAMDLSAQRQAIQMEALRKLVDSELVSQAATEQGWVISDGEIRDFITQDIPFFQEDGRFVKSRYDNYLRATNNTAGTFEKSLRKEKTNLRAYRIFETGVEPLSLDLAHQKTLKETEINVSFVRLNKAELSKKAQVADNEVSNSLSDPEFMKKVESDFKDNKTLYSEREQVKASHILVKGDTPEALAKAKAKIEQIAKRLEKEDFAKVAKETSEDTGSKDRGGDLGFFGKGQMDPAFEGAAFALEPGKLSGPVTTQFGVHLIKVFDKKAAKEYTLDEKKNEIARKLIAQEKSKTLVKDLEAALKDGNEAAINTQVKNLGGVWDETGAFRLDTEMIPKVSPSPQIQKVVFDLRQDKPFSTALVSDGAAEYVFKLKSSRAVPTPSEDKTMIQQMTRERSSDVYRKWVDGLRKQAKIEVNPALMQGNEAAQ